MEFSIQTVIIPDHDCDLVLVFPSGKEISIQHRPSNASGEDYQGSLDFILPEDTCVTNWKGDSMQPAPAFVPLMHKGPVREESRLAKQLCMEIP